MATFTDIQFGDGLVVTDLGAGSIRVDAGPGGGGGGGGPPTGSMVEFAGTAAPSGWLLCDGSAVSRTTYAALYAVVGTAYGAGDGSTTFNVPDTRGRATVGYAASGGHTEVATLGGNDGTALASRRPRHSHTNGVTASAASLTVNTASLTLPNHAHSQSLTLPNHGHSLSDPNHLHSILCSTNAGGGTDPSFPRVRWGYINPDQTSGDSNLNSNSNGTGVSVGNPTSLPGVGGSIGNPTSLPAVGGSATIGGSIPVAGTVGVTGSTVDTVSYLVVNKIIKT